MKDQDSLGHRERLRERFISNRFAGFHDYEVLEMLLTFIFRQGDVKPVAKELLRTFGSFAQVLDASFDELSSVKGLGINSAISLGVIREAMSYYYKSKPVSLNNQITKMSNLVEMIRSHIGHKSNEIFLALFFNAKNELLYSNIISEGTVSQVFTYPRKIVELALKHNAVSVIVAHNHPGGIAWPSIEDKEITFEIKKALSFVDISLEEHIILAGDEYYAFSRNELLT